MAEGAAETVVREFLSLEMAGDAESARVWAEARRYLANVTPHFTKQCGLSMFRGTGREVMESHVSGWSSLHLCNFTFCTLSGHFIFL